MKNSEDWQASKIIKKRGAYKPNLNSLDIQSYYICHTYLGYYINYIQAYSRGKLLDCGCGEVPYYEIYKDLVDEVVCTDWPNSMHKKKFIDVYSDLNERLDFEDNSFDTVLLMDVLEHIYQPKQLIAEISRVMKPSGRVIIAVPFLYRIHEEPNDYFRYTEYTLKRFCEEANLKVIKLDLYGKYIDVLFDTLNKVFIRKRFLLYPFMLISSLVKNSFINQKINKTHENKYPLGYILCAQKEQ